MSLANDPQFQQFLQTHKRVFIPNFGTVFIVKLTEPRPPGSIILTRAQGQQYLEQLKPILQEWSIVRFDNGGIGGSGYGYQFRDQVGNECSEGFIAVQGQY